MRPETEVRSELREWVASKAGIEVGAIDDALPLFSSGTLTSLHIPELILLLERLRQEYIDVERLADGDFRSIDAIVQRFFTFEATR